VHHLLRSLSSRAALGLITLAVTAASAAACGEDEPRECRVGADCASGVCTAEGRCLPDDAAPGGGDDAEDAGLRDGAASTDATPIDAAIPGCVPNEDGAITRDEIPIRAGLHAKFRVARDATVSTAGTTQSDGTRAWDFSSALTGDENVLVETLPLTDRWYAPKFEGASYATRLNQLYDLVGVFEVSPAALTLNGVVSPEDGYYRTELTYDPPVPALRFPLVVGDEWTTSTQVSGVAQGVPSSYSEKYETVIDAEGELATPLGKFHVLRIRGTMTRTVGFYTTRVRSFSFVTECYGSVAQVLSRDNEADVEFTRAAEIRRIAP
jgi:hypothetical protein